MRQWREKQRAEGVGSILGWWRGARGKWGGQAMEPKHSSVVEPFTTRIIRVHVTQRQAHG